MVVLEKTLESPLDSKEIKPVDPKGNQPWIFIGRTHTEAEAPICWPPDTKSWLIGKVADAGKDWKQEEKGTIGDEMLDGITDSMDMSLSKLLEVVKDREAWCAGVHRITKSRTRLSDWTTNLSAHNCLCSNLETAFSQLPCLRRLFNVDHTWVSCLGRKIGKYPPKLVSHVISVTSPQCCQLSF